MHADAALANVLVSSLPGGSSTSPFYQTAPPTPPADPASILAQAPFTARLCEDAVLSKTGAAAVQLPTPLACMSPIHADAANPLTPKPVHSASANSSNANLPPVPPLTTADAPYPAQHGSLGSQQQAKASTSDAPASAASPFSADFPHIGHNHMLCKGAVSARLAGTAFLTQNQIFLVCSFHRTRKQVHHEYKYPTLSFRYLSNACLCSLRVVYGCGYPSWPADVHTLRVVFSLQVYCGILPEAGSQSACYKP